jgi:hypothetical protein
MELARSTSLIRLNSQLKLNSKILKTCKKERESFRSLNAQGMRGVTLGQPFYRGVKGRAGGQGGWAAGTKILNFDAPPISKYHGEGQKEMWKKKNWKSEKVVAGPATLLVGQPANLPQSLQTFVSHSHMSHRCLSHRLKAKKSEKQLSLFFFPKFFLILFGILDF